MVLIKIINRGVKMKFSSHQLPVAIFVFFSLALAACSSSDGTNQVIPPTTADVSINFAAQVNGADFTCGQTYTGIGSGGDDLQVTDFRMYVYDAHIHDAATGEEYGIELTQDGIWQKDNVALLDFADGSAGCTDASTDTNTVLKGKVTVPVTVDLSSVNMCFTAGVPPEKNHVDTTLAESPLNAGGMFWFWKDGYKYIRIDGKGDPTGVNAPFNLHLGAQGCPGTETNAPPTAACAYPNTIEVCIDNFDVVNSVVAVDPAPVLEANDVKVNLSGPMTPPGCQSFINDADCDEVMPRLGLDYSYGGTANASTYTGGQKLFSKQ
jgi:uncharacterized repeat protein (TIGR04052 family)